jgi:hypothetical protein
VLYSGTHEFRPGQIEGIGPLKLFPLALQSGWVARCRS